MAKDETIMTDLRDMMQILVEGQNKLEGRFDGLEGRFDGLETKVDKLSLDVFELKETVNARTEDIKDIKSDIVVIKKILEKDAKKQKIHEEEHVANIGAHDRFENRIIRVEKELKLDPIYL